MHVDTGGTVILSNHHKELKDSKKLIWSLKMIKSLKREIKIFFDA